MKKLYQVAKDYIAKPLIGLALIVGISGCNEGNWSGNQYPQSKPDKQIVEVGKTYFTDWGFLDELNLLGNLYEHSPIQDDLEIELGDMDGDGDLDIVVGSKATGLKIYENRIPRQNK